MTQQIENYKNKKASESEFDVCIVFGLGERHLLFELSKKAVVGLIHFGRKTLGRLSSNSTPIDKMKQRLFTNSISPNKS